MRFLGLKVESQAVDWVNLVYYYGHMRKTADEELKPQVLPLINPCPKCGGQLKASILVGFGICRPQKQLCMSYCGFEKDIRKVQHG